VSESSRGFKKAFFWTFGILLVLIAGLIALSIGDSDRPFSYLGF
jgi:uncharacterized BrkB/YihY/UPF0761 family membrane protein